MPELHQYPLVTSSGRRGSAYRASRFLDRSDYTRVTLEDGSEFHVPSRSLRAQPDGSFLLDDSAVPDGGGPESPPEYFEPDPVEPAAARAEVKPVLVDEPLYVEDVEVERVPVNRIVDGPVETRQEGDITIIPVVEEVVSIQKRLLLKEEVRVRRRRRQVSEPRRIVMANGETRIIGADGREIRPRGE